MERITKGATLWARRTIESDIFYWKPPEWFKIWFYIVQSVNHSDKKQFKRGEGYFNWSEIKNDLKGVSHDQYNKCLKWLKWAKQIATRKTTRGNIIFVLNYDKYQTLQNYRSQAESQTESKAGAKQGQSKSQAINNNDKNVKNNNISKEIQPYGRDDINQVYSFLKEKIGGSPDGSIAENRRFAKLLLDRMKKDYPDKDPIKQVCSLIDYGIEDSFHGKNIASFKYLFYNTQKIIASVRNNKRKVVIIK